MIAALLLSSLPPFPFVLLLPLICLQLPSVITDMFKQCHVKFPLLFRAACPALTASILDFAARPQLKHDFCFFCPENTINL